MTKPLCHLCNGRINQAWTILGLISNSLLALALLSGTQNFSGIVIDGRVCDA